MPTMHNRQRRLTERELDRLQAQRQTEAAAAALQIIQRARRQQQPGDGPGLVDELAVAPAAAVLAADQYPLVLELRKAFLRLFQGGRSENGQALLHAPRARRVGGRGHAQSIRPADA